MGSKAGAGPRWETKARLLRCTTCSTARPSPPSRGEALQSPRPAAASLLPCLQQLFHLCFANGALGSGLLLPSWGAQQRGVLCPQPGTLFYCLINTTDKIEAR